MSRVILVCCLAFSLRFSYTYVNNGKEQSKTRAYSRTRPCTSVLSGLLLSLCLFSLPTAVQTRALRERKKIYTHTETQKCRRKWSFFFYFIYSLSLSLFSNSLFRTHFFGSSSLPRFESNASKLKRTIWLIQSFRYLYISYTHFFSQIKDEEWKKVGKTLKKNSETSLTACWYSLTLPTHTYMGAITGSVLVCMLTFNPGPIRTLLRRSYGSEANSHQSERRRKRIKNGQVARKVVTGNSTWSISVIHG